ncbi:tetraacyldisaccharide 4'-kinase [Deferrisoma palaeochoriense]
MSLYFWIKDILSRPALGLGSKLLLAPLAVAGWFYAQVQAARRWGYRRGVLPSADPGVPVVSVGNVAVGGTGKTPCVEWVCRWFLERGIRPAVLSRGYGGEAAGPVTVVSDGRGRVAGWREAGDEPVLLARRLPGVPVVVGPDRRLTARKAVELGARVLVLDDGFQHLRLRRHLDLVTVDVQNPFGNGWCLPRGLLREPPRALADADVVLLTRTKGVPPDRIERARALVSRYAPEAPVLATAHEPASWVPLGGGEPLPLEALRGKKVLAFAGIGKPEAFFRDLEALGLRVVEAVPFPDHHAYTDGDREQLARWAKLVNAEALVTTEKDGVRLGGPIPCDAPTLALAIELRVADPGPLVAELERIAAAAGDPPGA